MAHDLNDTLIFVLADNGRPFPRAKTRVHDSGRRRRVPALEVRTGIQGCRRQNVRRRRRDHDEHNEISKSA